MFQSQQPIEIDPRHLAEVFLAAVLVRAAYLAFVHFGFGPEAMMAEDSNAFILAAGQLASGQTLLGFDGQANFDGSLMPVPVVLMMLTGIGPDSVLGFLALQSVIDAGTCVLIGLTAARFVPGWFRLAGLIAAVNPTQIVLAGLVLSDSIFLFFTSAALLVIVDMARPGQQTSGILRAAILLGLSLGFALLTRSAILPWLPVAALAFVVLGWRRAGLMRSVLGVVLVSAIVSAALAPILYRNYQRHDAVIVTPQAGAHLLFWVVPLVANFGGVTGFDDAQTDATERRDAALAALNGEPTYAEKEAAARQVASEMLGEFGYLAVARAWIVGAGLNLGLPAASIAPPVRNLPHNSFYSTPGDGAVQKVLTFLTDAENRHYVIVLGLSSVLSLAWLALAAFGMIRLFRGWPLCAFILFIWLGYILALNGPVASPKYRLPIENVLVIAVAAALMRRPHQSIFESRS